MTVVATAPSVSQEKNEITKEKFGKQRGDPANTIPDGGLSTSAFEALERDFNDVLDGLAHDPTLDAFRVEYERLFRTLRKSHDQERRLVRKCRELNQAAVEGAAKVQAALRISRDDKDRTEEALRDAERAWALLEEAHGKETRATVTIERLKTETDRLGGLLEKAEAETSGRDNATRRLAEERDDLSEEVERATGKVAAIERRLLETDERLTTAEQDRDEMAARTSSLEDGAKSRASEVNRERLRRDRIDKELADVTSKLEGKSKEHVHLQYLYALKKNDVMQLEKELAEAKVEIDRGLSENEEEKHRMSKVADSLERQREKTVAMSAEVQAARSNAKLALVDQARISSERDRMERKYESERKDVLRHQQLVADAKSEVDSATAEVHSMRKELDRSKIQEESDRRDMDALVREKNLHMGRIQRVEDGIKRAGEDTNQRDQVIRSLEKDLAGAKEHRDCLLSAVRRLEKERDRHGAEACEACSKRDAMAEELRLRDMDLKELNKSLEEIEDKVTEEQQSHETSRSERRRLSKELSNTKAEEEKVTSRCLALNKEMKALQSELAAKDSALVKEHYGRRVEKTQKEQHRNEISQQKQALHQSDDIINRQNAELRRLGLSIRKMDEDALTQRKEYDQIINERDILGTQLIRRNDELALLYEKVKIQQTTLRRGEVQYQERLEDMRLLRLKIKDLRRELAVVRGGEGNVDEIMQELARKNRELLCERTKVRALSEELENPLNVHRWRNLEGSDPAAFEMIQKIQLLQKRLIEKTEQVRNTIFLSLAQE